MKRNYFYCTCILLILILTNCTEANIKEKSNNAYKEHIISKEKAITFKNEYINNRKMLFQPELRSVYSDSTFTDTEFVWFSLEDIKSYISFIDEIQEKHPNEDISGLRIYFMVYPNSADKYKGQQSVFIAPTVRSELKESPYETMNNLPFYLQSNNQENTNNNEIVLYKELMVEYMLEERFKNFNNRNLSSQRAGIKLQDPINGGSTSINTLFNEGEAYPPPPKG